MDVKDMLKFQFITGMSQSVNKGDIFMNEGGILYKILGMVCQAAFMFFIGFADELAKYIPGLLTYIKECIILKISSSNITHTLENFRQIPINENAVLLDKRHFTNNVSMSRIFIDEKKHASDQLDEMNGIIDAILKTLTKQHNVPSFRLIETAQLMLNYIDNPIQLNNDIYIKVEKIDVNVLGFISRIDVILMSNTVSASDISKYMKHVYNQHKEQLQNALGDTIYYFDQKCKESSINDNPRKTLIKEDIIMHKQMKIQNAPKSIHFSKAPFISNKNFNNIFGEGVRNIEKRISFFLKNKSWYDSRGIPYQLGLMMSGAPGTGKTSIIRAIANMTKRHIINVNFSNIASATQLKHLFFSDKLDVYTDTTYSNKLSYHIPVDQRIYVLEEIDTIGDILKQRTNDVELSDQHVHDEVTLGEILTVLDGTIETPGRIVIMTSNHPELLDEALIRPGRIDVMVKFDKANKQTISDMFQAFYDKSMNNDEIQSLPDKKLTPAEVSQVLFQHFDDDKNILVKAIINDFINTAKQNELTKTYRTNAQLSQKKKNFSDDETSTSSESSKEKHKTKDISNGDTSIIESKSLNEIENLQSYVTKTILQKQGRYVNNDISLPQAYNNSLSTLDDMYAPLLVKK